MAVTLRQSVDIRDPVDPEAAEESRFLRSTAASERGGERTRHPGDEQTHPQYMSLKFTAALLLVILSTA